ncbi:hypothetical protein AALP_AA5G289700 [Arabis alpina]|uniref:MBD domain-containing protein n=1 Tax=Arabis alpina TaxID=50452 RepID=A0A087H028_ARAAL|nr:hypothetical protein AALP_AA5G289700 [Arabis alpina]
MIMMTSSSTFLTGEEDEKHRPPSPEEDSIQLHSNRRRWSTPIDSDDENRGGKISPWGLSGPPLLRSNAATTVRGGGGIQRSGKIVTATKRDLPPFLTTLDCNGRPRFHHRRVRSEGRLEIASVAVDSPEIVSVRGIEGCVIKRVHKTSVTESREMEEEVIGKQVKRRSKKDVSPGRLVDTYAAQCVQCEKWRVIDNDEEYEEIRSRMLEDPFKCEEKQGWSCEKPTDIEYDSTRIWVMDKLGVPKTPKGFKRSLVLRKDYSKMDTYFISSTGKKLRSRNEIVSFVEANPEFKNVPLGDFNFTVPKIMKDAIPPDPKISSPRDTTTTTTMTTDNIPLDAKINSPTATTTTDTSPPDPKISSPTATTTTTSPTYSSMGSSKPIYD